MLHECRQGAMFDQKIHDALHDQLTITSQHPFMQEGVGSGADTKAGGLLSSFVRNIGLNVMGTQSLSLEHIQPALSGLKSKLMERNVAEEIAAK